jgi:hypothetical protein
MKKLLALLVVLVLFISVTRIANALTIIGGNVKNGNLDDTYAQLITGTFYLPKPTIWQNEGTRVITGPYEDEMASEPWAGPPPTPVTAGGNGLPSPDGCGTNNFDCGVFFKPFSGNAANGPATGRLLQDNPATPGMLYQMTGWAGAEANVLMADAQFSIRFLDAGSNDIGGTTLSLLPTLLVPNGEPFNYKSYLLEAIAPAGAVTVRAEVAMIGATPNPLGGGQAFVVDDLTLESFVPEPSALLLLGIGAISLLGRTKRQSLS